VNAFEVLPRVPIGRWPTPVRRLERTSEALGVEVWAKLEEACGAWGGNKVRKLEYILAHARSKDAKRLVTYGAGTSSWAAALVLHGSEMGFEVALGLGGDIPEANQALYDKLGVRVHQASSYSLTPVAAARAVLANAGRGTMRLAAGGSDRRGDLGSMSAGTEIADTIADGSLPRPARVYVAAGTSGTAAGIAVGLGVAGLSIPVVAVRVTPLPLGTGPIVRYHSGSLMRFLKSGGAVDADEKVSPIVGESRFFPPGYGTANEASKEAIEIGRADGVELDPTYAAKAFAALIADARAGQQGPLLLHLTSPGPLPMEP
jgi:D-cysteine desulfhydrase